jgi:hypothetical protein
MLNEEVEKIEEKEVDVSNAQSWGNLADSFKEDVLLELNKICSLKELNKLLELVKTKQLKLD